MQVQDARSRQVMVVVRGRYRWRGGRVPLLDAEASGVFSRRRGRVDRGPYLYDIPTPHSCRIYDRSICQIGELVVHLGCGVRICAIWPLRAYTIVLPVLASRQCNVAKRTLKRNDLSVNMTDFKITQISVLRNFH